MGCCRAGGKSIIIVAVSFRILNFILLAIAMASTTAWWYFEYKNSDFGFDLYYYFDYEQLYFQCESKGSATTFPYTCDDWSDYTSTPNLGLPTWKSDNPKTYDVYQNAKGLSAVTLAFCIIGLVVSVIHIFTRRNPSNAGPNRVLKHASWILDIVVMIFLVSNLAQFGGELPGAILSDCKKRNPSYSDQDCYENVPGSKYLSGKTTNGSKTWWYGSSSGFGLDISAIIFYIVTLILTTVATPSETPPVSPPPVAVAAFAYQPMGTAPVGGPAPVYMAAQPQPVMYTVQPQPQPVMYVAAAPAPQPAPYGQPAAYGQPAYSPYGQPVGGAPPATSDGTYPQPKPYQ